MRTSRACSTCTRPAPGTRPARDFALATITGGRAALRCSTSTARRHSPCPVLLWTRSTARPGRAMRSDRVLRDERRPDRSVRGDAGDGQRQAADPRCLCGPAAGVVAGRHPDRVHHRSLHDEPAGADVRGVSHRAARRRVWHHRPRCGHRAQPAARSGVVARRAEPLFRVGRRRPHQQRVPARSSERRHRASHRRRHRRRRRHAGQPDAVGRLQRGHARLWRVPAFGVRDPSDARGGRGRREARRGEPHRPAAGRDDDRPRYRACASPASPAGQNGGVGPGALSPQAFAGRHRLSLPDGRRRSGGRLPVRWRLAPVRRPARRSTAADRAPRQQPSGRVLGRRPLHQSIVAPELGGDHRPVAGDAHAHDRRRPRSRRGPGS